MYPMNMSFPDLATYEIGRDLAKELGLSFTMEHGPKEEAVEGLRLVRVSGLPDRIAMMQDLFAVKVTQMRMNRQACLNILQQSWDLSP